MIVFVFSFQIRMRIALYLFIVYLSCEENWKDLIDLHVVYFLNNKKGRNIIKINI